MYQEKKIRIDFYDHKLVGYQKWEDSGGCGYTDALPLSEPVLDPLTRGESTAEPGSEAGQLHGEKVYLVGEKNEYFFCEGAGGFVVVDLRLLSGAIRSARKNYFDP